MDLLHGAEATSKSSSLILVESLKYLLLEMQLLPRLHKALQAALPLSALNCSFHHGPRLPLHLANLLAQALGYARHAVLLREIRHKETKGNERSSQEWRQIAKNEGQKGLQSNEMQRRLHSNIQQLRVERE